MVKSIRGASGVATIALAGSGPPHPPWCPRVADGQPDFPGCGSAPFSRRIEVHRPPRPGPRVLPAGQTPQPEPACSLPGRKQASRTAASPEPVVPDWLPPSILSGAGSWVRAAVTARPQTSVMVVVVVMMMVMVALRERRTGNEHNHSEQQGLFHGPSSMI